MRIECISGKEAYVYHLVRRAGDEITSRSLLTSGGWREVANSKVKKSPTTVGVGLNTYLRGEINEYAFHSSV